MRPASIFGSYQSAVHFGYSDGDTTTVLGALSGAYFGITFVHFLYDRYVYSFRRPEVRKAVASYLFTSPPIHPPAQKA
jgi:hypothetical protein